MLCLKSWSAVLYHFNTVLLLPGRVTNPPPSLSLPHTLWCGQIMEWTGYIVQRANFKVNILVRLLLFADIKYSLAVSLNRDVWLHVPNMDVWLYLTWT